MNILLKAFDGEFCKEIVEATFRGMSLGTVLSVLEDTEQMADLDAEDHVWISAKKMRFGEYYEDIDWNAIAPLDEEIIERMRSCEAVFLSMIGRYEAKHTFAKHYSYNERQQQYFNHLQYWNHILETKKIDLFLSNHVPHQGYDFVIYELCKFKGIPTLMLERCHIIDTFFVIEDWEKSTKELAPKMQELRERYSETKEDIPLSERYEQFYQYQTTVEEKPWYFFEKNISEHLKHKNFFCRWSKTVVRLLTQKPFKMLRLLMSPTVWRRKLKQHAIITFYDRHAQDPDLSKPFIYVPLHMQPEESTNPRGGAFMDQERIVELLAWHLPPNIRLYVKEHPHQADFMRSKEYYMRLMNIPSVTLVTKSFNSLQLIKRALAVATCTGTAGFEGLFHETPMLMFGHNFYQYSSGVHTISSSQDCKKSLEQILAGKGKPSKRDMRLFLKAIEECGPETMVGKIRKHPKYSYPERAKIMGKYIGEKIRARMGM